MKYGVFPGTEVKQKKSASVGIQCDLLTDKVDQGVVTTKGQPLACLLVIHLVSNILILFGVDLMFLGLMLLLYSV